jgi:hypothetical protein
MTMGELQMMTAFLRMDGRYEASVAMVSFTDMQLIKGCFELLQSHLSAKKYEEELMDAKEEELREIAKDLFQEIINKDMRARAQVQYVMEEQEKYSAECSAMVNEKYRGSKEDLYLKYDNQMNSVVKNVLFFYPDLLQKRVISETIIGEQHLFSMRETLRLMLMMHHLGLTGLVFFDIAVVIQMEQQKFPTH